MPNLRRRRERSSTLEREQNDPYTYLDESDNESDGEIPEPELVPEHLLEDENRPPSKRLIIAVDFGTTYSAVSYVALEEGESDGQLDLDRIQSIKNFPDDWNLGANGDRMKFEVPTEVIYPLDRHFREKEDLKDVAADEAPQEPGSPAIKLDLDEDEFSFDDSLAVFGQRDDDAMSIDEAASFRWGYGVHEAWGLPATHSDPTNQPLSRFKLLLDNSPTTETVRLNLKRTIDGLKKRRIIRNPEDVIVDFLTCLLRHTKTELTRAGFDDSYRTEIVLCVPAIWSQKACRDMQTAMAKAMIRARFNGVDVQNDSIENLFIVSEPEAASAYVLATGRHISPGDTFVLLDAGGGTIDANTYTVSATNPLRLTREVVPPGGGLYGSSYLNEGFRELLQELLADERYLENDDSTINGHIERVMINIFEYRFKRSFDCYEANGYKRFEIPGLRDNSQKKFMRGCAVIHVDKIKEIFITKCLQGVASVMENQINAARENGAQVEKVLLIGGFASSPSLKKYIQHRLERYNKGNGCHVSLFVPENTTTAVASGAVLRAFNKEQGPRRHARSSYGILRTEPYREFPEHRGIKPTIDKHDGQPYISKTIDWVLKLGAEVEPVWRCQEFLCSHTFDTSEERLLCEEVLYVSDRSTRSHYQLKHRNNEGAERVGEILVDFTFLRDQGLIQPIDGGLKEGGTRVGRRHYRVTYTMVIRVVDRDLQCYAIYDGRVRQKCRLNIASAFSPGVK